MIRRAYYSNVRLKEIIVVSGFFNGVWLSIGVNPEAELWKVLKIFIESMFPDMAWFAVVVPILIEIVILGSAFALGGWVGLSAVGIAFIGGLLILQNTIPALVLLITALAIGRHQEKVRQIWKVIKRVFKAN